MRYINKITNIALILMLIGMAVCQDVYGLRVPIGEMKEARAVDLQRSDSLSSYAESILILLKKNEFNLSREKEIVERKNEKMTQHDLGIDRFYNSNNILLFSKSIEPERDMFLLIDTKEKKISEISAGNSEIDVYDENTRNLIKDPAMHLIVFVDTEVRCLMNVKIDTEGLNKACVSYLIEPTTENLKKIALAAKNVTDDALQKSITAKSIDYFTLRCISNGINANLSSMLDAHGENLNPDGKLYPVSGKGAELEKLIRNNITHGGFL